MTPDQQIGTLVSPSELVRVQRNGDTFNLKQGDAVFSGDVIQNGDNIAVDIELPASTSGQADSLVTLSPQAGISLSKVVAADGVSEVVEVVSLTEGVELYALGEGDDGAMLIADSGGEFSGLLGAGLLAGSGATLGTAAAAAGGAVALGALAATGDSNDDPADVSMNDNTDTSTPDTGTGTDTDTGTDGSDTEQPAPEASGPLSSVVQQLTDALPLEQVPAVGEAIETGLVDGVAQLESVLGLSSPPDAGSGTDQPATEAAGPLSGGAEQLTGALPLEQIPTIGETIESGLVDGAAQLESVLGLSSPPDAGSGTDQPATEAAGPLSGGAEQLTGALPLEQIPTLGETIESGLVDGAAQLEGMLIPSGTDSSPLSSVTGALSNLPGADALTSTIGL